MITNSNLGFINNKIDNLCHVKYFYYKYLTSSLDEGNMISLLKYVRKNIYFLITI